MSDIEVGTSTTWFGGCCLTCKPNDMLIRNHAYGYTRLGSVGSQTMGSSSLFMARVLHEQNGCAQVWFASKYFWRNPGWSLCDQSIAISYIAIAWWHNGERRCISTRFNATVPWSSLKLRLQRNDGICISIMVKINESGSIVQQTRDLHFWSYQCRAHPLKMRCKALTLFEEMEYVQNRKIRVQGKRSENRYWKIWRSCR